MNENELTESEILENQFKKQKQLHNNSVVLESLKQDKEQAHNNSVVLESLKQDKEQAHNNSVVLEGQPSYISTGIKYLDDKIKSRSLSAFDYYMARKYLGIDLNVNLNGNLNIVSENQTRVKNLTSATSKIFDGLKALNLGDRLIQKAQDNSGFFSALKRLVNEKTNGFYSLNSDEAETMNALKNYSYSTARQMGGQLTNQKIKDAQEMTKFGFRSKEENTARLGENQGRLIQILEQDINNLESLGGRASDSVMLELLKHKKRLEHIQKNQGRIKLKEYQEITPYSKMNIR
ncbi:Coiled-coil domain-containing protein [Helicobacter pylori]|uniref:Coiled-coil domain-containing protein n=1 Tax=Helicobacter pylori TaxID=210 RepID=UPI000EB060B2|nr:Coiled-coil domain-containing protein [Helicobacter pylori]RKV15253.1 Coiled-coil domain-containing protein [Helicobacter pylori]WQX60973.1 Coiled-coil domain-containing protein [Helicobacter pylori]